MKTCRRTHSLWVEYCRCVLFPAVRLLVDVLSGLPSARYVAWWGHPMASGTLGHFPSEEQQCFDLWESSPLCKRVWGHVFQFACSRVFRPPRHPVSTRLCSYENIARQTEACPVPSSWTMEENMSLTLYRLVACEIKWLHCVGLCLSIIKSQ